MKDMEVTVIHLDRKTAIIVGGNAFNLNAREYELFSQFMTLGYSISMGGTYKAAAEAYAAVCGAKGQPCITISREKKCATVKLRLAPGTGFVPEVGWKIMALLATFSNLVLAGLGEYSALLGSGQLSSATDLATALVAIANSPDSFAAGIHNHFDELQAVAIAHSLPAAATGVNPSWSVQI